LPFILSSRHWPQQSGQRGSHVGNNRQMPPVPEIDGTEMLAQTTASLCHKDTIFGKPIVKMIGSKWS
jgi:hypothetical protein